MLQEEYDLVLADLHAGELAGLPVHAADITQTEPIDRLMPGVEAVVHLAISNRQGSVGELPENADDVMAVNVMGTQHVFEAARRHGVTRIVYISSITVYLGVEVPQPGQIVGVGVNTPLHPRGLYACTKLFGEYLGQHYCDAFGMTVVCLRLGQPYPLRSGWRHTLDRPRVRGLIVGLADIAQAIRCGLNYHGEPRFVVADIVSESDSRWIDLTAAERIGYKPTQFCTPDGFEGWPAPPPPEPGERHGRRHPQPRTGTP
jgi:NAD(P)-dependent dehydrogenase (short-subunit alcohol dehydrogenase family)